MERLTMRNDKGMAFWADHRCAGGGYRMTENKEDHERLDRLAAYEDTGLEPEEVTDLQQAWDMYGGEEGITAMLTPPNTPLTLDELREMDGEPVWFEYLYPLNPPEGVWTIARGIRNNDTAIFDGLCAMSLDHYGETWQAYRRKPKDGDEVATVKCAHGKRGHPSHEWNDGEKDHIYCLGWADKMTDELLPECQRCPDHVSRAQDDFDKWREGMT